MKILFAIFTIALFSVSNANAQTRQFDLSASFDGVIAWCLNRPVSGEYTYHVSYHLDKNGNIDNFHWNIKHADVWDTETGEKYIIQDTGNDNIGYWWDFYNNIVSYTGIPYNVSDGWLPVPDVLPEEGTMVGMGFKFIAKGTVYKWSTMYQLHRNAKGEIKVDFYNEKVQCNE